MWDLICPSSHLTLWNYEQISKLYYYSNFSKSTFTYRQYLLQIVYIPIGKMHGLNQVDQR